MDDIEDILGRIDRRRSQLQREVADAQSKLASVTAGLREALGTLKQDFAVSTLPEAEQLLQQLEQQLRDELAALSGALDEAGA